MFSQLIRLDCKKYKLSIQKMQDFHGNPTQKLCVQRVEEISLETFETLPTSLSIL